jgi:ACS family hexuronate transporter-like MFS transporter
LLLQLLNHESSCSASKLSSRIAMSALASDVPARAPSESPPPVSAGRYRWVICGLLFACTTINYIDRQVIGVLKPELKGTFGWTETDFARIIFWFQAAYALGFLFSGRVVRWLGCRTSLALFVLAWSVCEMAHALVRSVTGFCFARFGLGLAEGGNFPASIQTVTEWFSKTERALATGIFNAGCNVGAVITPLLIPWLASRYSWQAAFLVTGGMGLVWLISWILLYDKQRQHRCLAEAESAHNRSESAEATAEISWLNLLRHRQTWAFCIGMCLAAPVGWFYLYWIPGFFHDRYNLDMIHLGLPLVVLYQMAFFGSIGGGWLSAALMKRGWGAGSARKTAFLVCALCVVPVFAATHTSKWVTVLLIGLAYAAHMGFATNLFTMVSDTVPRQAVSALTGLGGMVGALGGMFAARIIGAVLDWTHNNYQGLFVACSMIYLLALLLIHLINPRYEPLRCDGQDKL